MENKRLWGPDDRLTPEGHEIGGRIQAALRLILEECADEGRSLRDVLALINQEAAAYIRRLLEEKAGL